MSFKDVLMFWGKASPVDPAVTFHPIVYHLLDVAAAADALLEARPLVRARAGWLLGLDPSEARHLLVALIALHDLGKFAPAFQVKQPAHWPSVLGPCEPSRVGSTRHTDDGFVLWSTDLAQYIGERLWRGGAHALEALAPAIFGHHGRPVAPGKLREMRAEWSFRGRALEAAMECADAVTTLLLPQPILAEPPSRERAKLASWWVAGLVTIADWIGSRERWFKYIAPDAISGGLAGYWAYAREQARQAVSAQGLEAAESATRCSFASLTGIAMPSPAQAWAETVELPAGPLLVLVEDVTGAGKTEVAQALVHRLMAAGRASGAYWAMPTQATANAMYMRQADALHKLFAAADGNAPSLILSHGQTRLHDRFRATVMSEDLTGSRESAREEVDREELSGTVACAAFFADDRRAAFLADVGAGTIDQALLGILPSKFNTVRLFGLADKVLIVDEAHAYDAYMNVELRELLRFHAALGGCAVVLSATLSLKQRQSLAEAWMEGLDGGRKRAIPIFSVVPQPAPLVRETAYPLATVVEREGGVVETRLEAAHWSCRSVAVRFVNHMDAAVEHLTSAVARGAAAAWVRNTVDDCLAGAAALRARGLAPLVFHARFAQGDRQRRESEVLRLFGKGVGDEDRRGRVLVATQVIEQSLDLDFDVLVSDLAPVDLLIQRVGRLWRHPTRDAARPTGLEREVVVLAPPLDLEPASDWLTTLLPGTARVYQNAGVLWRTVRVLAEKKAIETPGGLRDLVEAVYGSAEEPDALQRASDMALAKDRAAASTANQAALRVANGYHGDAQGWIDEVHALTRLSEPPAITVRLARVSADGELVPWELGALPPWKAWALSEIRPRASRVPPGALAEPNYRSAVQAVRAEWGRFERDLPVLPLVEMEPGVWRGTLITPELGRVVGMEYTADEGLDYQWRSG